MQTKLFADIGEGIFPLDLAVERGHIDLHYEYKYSDDTLEYSILRDGSSIGHIGWSLSDTALKISEIHIHDVMDQFCGNVADETSEGIGSAIIRSMLKLSAGLRRQNFIIWNTRNYALLHLARKLSAEINYVLLNNNCEPQGATFDWPQLLAGLDALSCQFLLGGNLQKPVFVKDENGSWQTKKTDSPYRLEFTGNDRINIYYENFLIPKPHISVVGARFDIIIPMRK